MPRPSRRRPTPWTCSRRARTGAAPRCRSPRRRRARRCACRAARTTRTRFVEKRLAEPAAAPVAHGEQACQPGDTQALGAADRAGDDAVAVADDRPSSGEKSRGRRGRRARLRMGAARAASDRRRPPRTPHRTRARVEAQRRAVSGRPARAARARLDRACPPETPDRPLPLLTNRSSRACRARAPPSRIRVAPRSTSRCSSSRTRNVPTPRPKYAGDVAIGLAVLRALLDRPYPTAAPSSSTRTGPRAGRVATRPAGRRTRSVRRAERSHVERGDELDHGLGVVVSHQRLHRNELIEHLWQREGSVRCRDGDCAPESSPTHCSTRSAARAPRTGTTSWKGDAATCTCRSRGARVRAKNSSQWRSAGLYEPISCATTTSSNGRPSARAMPRCSRVGVRKHAEASSRGGAGRLSAPCTSGNERQPGQRLGEAVLLGRRCAQGAQRLRHHLPVAQRRIALDLGLDLVVALEQRVGPIVAEDARQLGAHPAVPVDQGADVERRPPLHGVSLEVGR